MEDKAYCVLRPNDLPIIIKPTRLRRERRCVLTGAVIKAGEYAYPAMKTPLRIWPYGDERASISAGVRRLGELVPNHGVIFRIPAFSEVMQRREIADQQKKFQKQLDVEATRLLKEARVK